MRIVILCLNILILGAHLTFSQTDTLKFSLPEAEERFLQYNLILLAEHYRVDKAEAEVIQAKTMENPTISFEQNIYNGITHKYFDFGKHGQQMVDIEQVINLAGQRNKRVKMERANAQIARYEYEELVRQLKLELKTEMIMFHYISKSIIIYAQEIEQIERLLKVFEKQFDEGHISLLEKSRLQAMLFLLKKEHKELVHEQLTLQHNLAVFLNIPENIYILPVLDEFIEKQLEFRLPSFTDMEKQLPNRSDIKIAETAILFAEENLKWQKSMRAPEFSIKGSYDRQGNFMDNYFGIGFTIGIPVFNRNQGNVKIARYEQLQNQVQKKYTLNKARNELSAIYRKIEMSISLYQDFDVEMEKSFALILNGINENFQKRNISILEFIDYYETYKDVLINLYDTEKELLLMLEELNYIMGS